MTAIHPTAVIDSQAHVRMQAGVEVVIDFDPATGGMDLSEREGVTTDMTNQAVAGVLYVLRDRGDARATPRPA